MSNNVVNPYRYAGVPEPDYEENFDTNPTDGDWTLTGSSVSYDASAKNITLDAIDDVEDVEGLQLDLQDVLSGSNLDNTKFVVQFVWKATSWTDSGAAGYGGYHDIGFWLFKDAAAMTATKFAFGGGNTGGVSWQREYSMAIGYERTWEAFEIDSQTPINRRFATSGVDPVTGTTIGVRMVRTSSTAMRGEIYANADFDSTPTIASLDAYSTLIGNIQDLRYIFIAGYLQAGGSAVNQATLDSIKIWNGINL